jgi:hypothetical protein
MTYLSREQILSRTDLKTEDVPIGDDAGMVRVRELTGTELDEYQASLMQQVEEEDGSTKTVPDMSNRRAKLLVFAIVDEAGVNLFTEFDVAKVGRLPGAMVDKLFTVAERLSAVNQNAAKEITANFEPDPNESSTSP